VINREDIVAKLNLLDVLEGMSPYRARADYSQRVFRAISQLEAHPDMNGDWLEAALTVFANARYVTTQMFDDAWRSLYRKLLMVLSSNHDLWNVKSAEILRDVHFFENDPSGMINQFFHVNEIHGRLDTGKVSRINDVEKLGKVALEAVSGDRQRAKAARDELSNIAAKKVWVVLVDKSISSHSLSSDLDRIAGFRQLAGLSDTKIVLLVQIMTAAAKATIAARPAAESLIRDGNLHILSAITIPHSYSITNASYALISDGRVMENAKRLCEWFAESFILRDTQLNRMRAQSGDNLEYGYRKAGLTLSDNHNCPTGTLPIFWHSVKNASFVYDAPYERIHSRHGDQDKEQTESLWKSVLSSSRLAGVLAEI